MLVSASPIIGHGSCSWVTQSDLFPVLAVTIYTLTLHSRIAVCDLYKTADGVNLAGKREVLGG